MRKLFSAACLVVMIVLITGCDFNYDIPVSDNWDKIINLEGNWKFSIGDDSVWSTAKFNDESWDEILVPSSWENEGFHGYNGF